MISVPRPGSPVQWTSCRPAGPSDRSPIPTAAECGLLSVPVNWDNKDSADGAVAQIAIVRFKATGEKIGSLIVNPGGPGESGVNAAASMIATLPEELRQRFDLVGFDPRGVAHSSPAVWCNSDADNDRLRADNVVAYTPEGVAHIEKLTKEFVQRCVDKMGKDFLANVGTASVVRDLDAIRQALGDEKLTYLGYSYGTRIGAGYAEAYPDKVRAMILDGAVDPERRPDPGRHPPGRGLPEGLRRLRRGLREGRQLPAGHRPGQGGRDLPAAGVAAGRQRRPRPPIPAD